MQGPLSSGYTVSSTYCLAILRKGNIRFYLKKMKNDERWQITADLRSAFQFDFSSPCEDAIKDYCHMYGVPDYDFAVMRMTEEILVVRGS